MQSRRASTKSKQAQNTSTQNTGRGIGLGIWFFNFVLNVKTELPHTSKVNQSFCHKCYQGGKKVRLPGPDLSISAQLLYSCQTHTPQWYTVPQLLTCSSTIEKYHNWKREQEYRCARVYPCSSVTDVSISVS